VRNYCGSGPVSRYRGTPGSETTLSNVALYGEKNRVGRNRTDLGELFPLVALLMWHYIGWLSVEF